MRLDTGLMSELTRLDTGPMSELTRLDTDEFHLKRLGTEAVL